MACQHVLAQRRIVDPERAASAHITLAGTPHSAPLARIFLRENLRAHVPVETLKNAELLTTELVANVVLHAGTSVHVGLAWDDARLLVTVHHYDYAPQTAAGRRRAAVTQHAEAGRRMVLVETLADECGSAPLPDEPGTLTWFVLGLYPTSSRQATATGAP